MNAHSTSTYNSPFAKGWTGNNCELLDLFSAKIPAHRTSKVFIDPNTYIYYNVTVQHNKDVPVTLTGNYSTDFAANSSLAFLDQAIAAQQDNATEKPFFIGVAPIGPHSETIAGVFNPPVPADRHKNLFPHLKIPRKPNFNPDVVSGSIMYCHRNC
jgi:N-acetylglucosamine-6-sulfatase